jgi:hypothetical protein
VVDLGADASLPPPPYPVLEMFLPGDLLGSSNGSLRSYYYRGKFGGRSGSARWEAPLAPPTPFFRPCRRIAAKKFRYFAEISLLGACDFLRDLVFS